MIKNVEGLKEFVDNLELELALCRIHQLFSETKAGSQWLARMVSDRGQTQVHYPVQREGGHSFGLCQD